MGLLPRVTPTPRRRHPVVAETAPPRRLRATCQAFSSRGRRPLLPERKKMEEEEEEEEAARGGWGLLPVRLKQAPRMMVLTVPLPFGAFWPLARWID